MASATSTTIAYEFCSPPTEPAPTDEPDPCSIPKSRFSQALGDLLYRGAESGEVRSDVDATDVILLLGALSLLPSSEWDT